MRWACPFQGQFVICRLGLAYKISNLYSLTMKVWRATQNVEIGMDWWVIGDPRSLAISPFHTALMTSYSTLIETMHLTPIGYGFWVMASYWSKVTYFNQSHLHLAPLGVTLFEFWQNLWHPKIEYLNYRVVLFTWFYFGNTVQIANHVHFPIHV